MIMSNYAGQAVTAREGSSRFQVLLGLSPLSSGDMFEPTDGGFEGFGT
jgi:hypothetical protein